MMSGQAPPKSRLNLNKRVAFPMQNSSQSSTSNVPTADSGLPLPFSTSKYNPAVVPPSASPLVASSATGPPIGLPPPIGTPLPPLQSTVPASANISVAAARQSNGREYCYRIFSNVLKSSTAPFDTTKTIEIERRLEILNNAWTTEKFDSDLENRLCQIAQGMTIAIYHFDFCMYSSNRCVYFFYSFLACIRTGAERRTIGTGSPPSADTELYNDLHAVGNRFATINFAE